MQKRSMKTRSLKWVTILVAIAMVMGTTFGSAYALYTTPLFSDQENAGDGTTVLPRQEKNDPNVVLAKEETVNFLVVGTDESNALTDVMMIVNLDTKSGQINVLQVPRDTYVGEDGGQTGKINSVYGNPLRGKTRIETLIGVINQYYKISIDHYVTITLDSFIKMVDIVGGVEVDVPVNVVYEGNVALKKGKQTLNGTQAEWFIRYRAGYSEGDVGRQGAQVIFLKALLEKMLTASFSTVRSIASQSLNEITTDLTLQDLLHYYDDVTTVGKENIVFHRVPGEGVTYNGYAIYGVDVEGLADLLNQYFRPTTPDVPTSDLPFEDIKTIKNSSGYKAYGTDSDTEDTSSEEEGATSSDESGDASSEAPYLPESDDRFDYMSAGESSSRGAIQR